MRRKMADQEDKRRLEEMEKVVRERVSTALKQFNDALTTIRYVH